MAASSVTGTGPGESGGLQKPHLHSGCGCCSQASSSSSQARRKTGCVVRTKVQSPIARGSFSGGSIRSGSCF